MITLRSVVSVFCALTGWASMLSAHELMEKPMVWAHYTPWHTPLNTSISARAYYNYPLFKSAGSNLLDWAAEYRQAEAQGINGFLVDVVFNRTGGKTAYSDTISEMLKAAEGSYFEIGLCLDVKTTVQQQVSEVARMLAQVGAHPNYPKYDGKPVVATYSWGQWKPEEWAEIRAQLQALGHDIYLIANAGRGYTKLTREWLESYAPHFDMVYSFALDGLDGTPRGQTANLIADVAEENGKAYMAGFWPGYYGAWLNGRNDFYQPHRGFDQLHECFQLLRKGRDRWLHFTTWNDHDETSILPMLFTSANPLITKAYIDDFKGIAPTATRPEVCFAYHREEIPGTLLRIEALNLPSLASEPVIVTGKLLDRHGKPVATLEARTLAAAEFGRTEWLVPTAELARTPVLTPKITVTSGNYTHTAKLPPVLLINGWHQNAVTVKVAASKYIQFPNTLTVEAGAEGVVEAAVSFESAEEIVSATLFRNDRPLAVFGGQTEGKTLLNLFFEGPIGWKLTLEEGEILNAVRKFSDKGSADFVWNKSEAVSRQPKAWTPAGLLCAVTPETKLIFTVDGSSPFTMTAGELNAAGIVRRGSLAIEVSAVETTVQKHEPINATVGGHRLSVLTRAPQITDMFYVRYVLADGRVALSDISYPFAVKRALVPVQLVQTSVNLETPSGGTGMPGENEYLSDNVPFRTPMTVEGFIPLESVRTSQWNFDGTGRDSAGDNSVLIDPALFVPADDGEGMVLKLDGKKPLKMPLRTWPIGNATVDFQIKPSSAEKAPGPQSIIGRKGWSDAISINLLPDGRLEVVRNGSATVPQETVISETALPFDSWIRVRVTNDSLRVRIYINGRLDAEKAIRPARSYGNSTWFVGGGYEGYAYYRGHIDNLTVRGAAFAPENSGALESE